VYPKGWLNALRMPGFSGVEIGLNLEPMRCTLSGETSRDNLTKEIDMGSLHFLSDHRKGEGKMVCESCGSDREPIEKNFQTAIVCGACAQPFSYFQNSDYFYKKKQQRLKEDRAKDNKSVKRSHKL
jgi:hypothetical protein